MTVRPATEQDVTLLLRLFRELAAYEGRPDECVATAAALRNALFGDRTYAEAIIAEVAGEPAGFALFFHYFAPYQGLPATYLELLYVVPERRGAGIGRRLLHEVARIAVEQGAGRLEWGVLKRNEPAIEFYARLGATFVSDFMACRLEGDTLRRVAAESSARRSG